MIFYEKKITVHLGENGGSVKKRKHFSFASRRIGWRGKDLFIAKKMSKLSTLIAMVGAFFVTLAAFVYEEPRVAMVVFGIREPTSPGLLKFLLAVGVGGCVIGAGLGVFTIRWERKVGRPIWGD